jgi:2-succinyl-5-enolpyruvyl-6-hydroxy-3-cyclohexene-1-carboxylate synthase
MRESKCCYSDEKNAQIVIALLKAHGIRKVIANPGTTNIAIVGSVQNDPWFEVYSGVDERHSAYMATGMAAESDEPVVLSCTGATASRNYLPALTEAYYRKLPILVLTSMQPFDNVGQLYPQAIDRTVAPRDAVMKSIQCRAIKDDRDYSVCERQINDAILELRRHGGGPVHVNLEISDLMTFRCDKLPTVTRVDRIDAGSENFPQLPSGKIALFIGSGRINEAWADFARQHNVAVIADCSNKYDGPNRVYPSLVCSQTRASCNPAFAGLKPDLIICTGEVSGDYPGMEFLRDKCDIWRVSEDGEIRSRLGLPRYVFEMSATQFVHRYKSQLLTSSTYYEEWSNIDKRIRSCIPEIPFSNPWIAKMTSPLIPDGCVLHLGILNSLRSWNIFHPKLGVSTYSNVGGFGIDGGVSSLIGSSIIRDDKLHFGVFGDLAFFYDLNSLGNRYIGKNLRILVVNNGCGTEFNMYFHSGSQFGSNTNDFIAAGGHFGNKNKNLLKHYATDLGFRYLSASNKNEFEKVLPMFLHIELDRSIILECFTDVRDESEAHRVLNNIMPYEAPLTVKSIVGKMMPSTVKDAIKLVVKGRQ